MYFTQAMATDDTVDQTQPVTVATKVVSDGVRVGARYVLAADGTTVTTPSLLVS